MVKSTKYVCITICSTAKLVMGSGKNKIKRQIPERELWQQRAVWGEDGGEDCGPGERDIGGGGAGRQAAKAPTSWSS